jgi:hypothetical protein
MDTTTGTRNVVIGIDDTDNLEPDSVGTGRVACAMATVLVERGLGVLLGVTRHQLLIHPAIPYTSHNSSLCIGLDTAAPIAELARATARELVGRAQVGSDPGLCVFALDGEQAARRSVEVFGLAAAERVLTKDQAYAMAKRVGAHLSEHGGTGQGVIGALAAVGQRSRGESGWFVDAPGVRALEDVEMVSVAELLAGTAIARVERWDGTTLDAGERVATGGRLRPSLRCGVAVLLVEPATGAPGCWAPVEHNHPTRNGHDLKNKKTKTRQ